MKQKDIPILIVIVIIAAVFSSIIAHAIFGSTKNHNLKVPVVQPISNEFPHFDNDNNYKSIFNEQALDPTQLIKIGTSPSTTPFQ
jgi:hypothetical protein